MKVPALRLFACGMAVSFLSSCVTANRAWDSTTGFVGGVFERDTPPKNSGEHPTASDEGEYIPPVQKKPFRPVNGPAERSTASTSASEPSWMEAAKKKVKTADRETAAAQASPSPRPKIKSEENLPPVEESAPKTTASRPEPSETPAPKESIVRTTPKSTPEPKEETASAPASSASRDSVPTAEAVPGKPGMVRSPFSNTGLIDVTGLPPGSEARDPYTGKVFKVP